MLEIRNSSQQECVLVATRSAGHMRAPHQQQPEEQADEQQDLPDAAEVDVLVALWPNQNQQVAELLLDAQPLAGQRADDDDEQRAEQHVDAERWHFGSSPLTAGAMYSPVASQAVAIQKMPSCMCQVRVTV